MTNYPDPEADFHSRLYVRISDYLSETPDAPFSAVSIEEDAAGGRADIFLESHQVGSLIIEVKRADVNPRSSEVIKQARNYADDTGAEFFATCNANDFFLFDYRGEFEVRDVDFYYLNLRDQQLSDSIPEILNAVVHLYQENQLPNQHERERIVGVLRSFHSSVWPTLKYLSSRAYESNEKFIDLFDAWVKENDYVQLPESEQLELAAKQYAYLLTNRVLFYEVVRERTPDPIKTESGFQLDSLVGEASIDSLEDHLSRKFEEIIYEVDYEPIFTPDTGLFEEFPHNTKTRRATADLVENIERRSITEIDEDLLGEIYEELIPVDERKALGQYYTHPKIAETIVRWALPDEETVTDTGSMPTVPRVLDPASGSGTFTVEAYQRIAELHPSISHQEIVNQLVSVDINRFPLHLTSLNVASQNIEEETEVIHAYNSSFFNLDPQTDPLVSDRLEESDESFGELGMFDAVVGNPPYIRQENLYPNKEHFRQHLKTFGRSDRTTYYDGSKKLSKKSDAYVYFVTHGAQFLREGGRLGYIIPTKWMMTDYGRSFQDFLFDHFKIQAVVGFSVRAFEDALVDTALLLLERCADAEKRANTITKFIRLKKSMEVEHIIDTIQYDEEIPDGDDMVIKTRPNYRTVAIKQSDVAAIESGKLGHFLSVPQDIIQLVEHPKLIKLEDVAEVAYGNKTGANPFFFLDSDDVEDWAIDERFLTPAIKSIRDTESQEITAETTDRFLLDIDDYVKEVERNGGIADGSDLTDRVKRALSRDGYDGLKEYIEAGEREGYHERNTCAAREVWFNLGELKKPEILHPKFFNDRIIPMWNRDRLAPSNAVDGIYLDDDVDDEVMIGILNSTVHKTMLECWGRAEGGGALQLMTYEMESLPLVDPGLIQGEQREEFKQTVRRLLEGDEDAQSDLDQIILDVLGVGFSVKDLQDMQSTIAQRRIQSGDEVEVLMERIDEFDEVGTRSFSTSLGEDDDTTTLGEFADG